jgi:hypothetical protein
MQVYPMFSDRLSQDDFISRIEGINWEDGSFIRASSLFLLSQKCLHCERTLALSLLCSSIEAMTPKHGQVSFYSWLAKNKLDDLVMRNKLEIKRALESAQNEWLNHHDREGALHNFKQFLLDNCPAVLTTPPIMDSNEHKMQFEDALVHIYGKFRSLFLHEGLSYASYNIPRVTDFEISHVLMVGRHLYFVDLIRIIPWFSNVVKESLFKYLTSS